MDDGVRTTAIRPFSMADLNNENWGTNRPIAGGTQTAPARSFRLLPSWSALRGNRPETARQSVGGRLSETRTEAMRRIWGERDYE
jgi:hypothetical protein